MRVGVLLLGALLVAPLATAQQPVDPASEAAPLVGPFLIRDLLELLDEDPFDADAVQNRLTEKAIRSARELGSRRYAFGLSSTWASARPGSGSRTAARDARQSWKNTYMNMIWRHIYRR